MRAARDPGLQPERTKLSWDRTLLACAAGAIVTVRVFAPALGVGAVILGALAASAVLALAAGSRSRHRHVLDTVRRSEHAPAMLGGSLLLALAALVAAGAATGLVVAVLPR